MMNNRIRPGFRPNAMGGGGGGMQTMRRVAPEAAPNQVTGGGNGATGGPGRALGHLNREQRPGLGLGRGNLAARQGAGGQAGDGGAGAAGAGAQRRGRGLGRQNMMAALGSLLGGGGGMPSYGGGSGGGMSPYGYGGGMPWGFMSSPGFGGYGGYGFSPGLPAFNYGSSLGTLGNEAGTGTTDGVATEGATSTGIPTTNPNFGQLMSLLSALGWQQ